MTIEPLPTRDDFWDTIERAWLTIRDGGARARLLSENAEERVAAAETLINNHTQAMLDALRTILCEYQAPQLAAWDAHCERALYDIDREDVHEALDGSDDGFLYCRGFVVAAGRKHYEAVLGEPLKWGIMDAEEESMCYFATHLYNELFGEWPPRTGISRESSSNKEGDDFRPAPTFTTAHSWDTLGEAWAAGAEDHDFGPRELLNKAETDDQLLDAVSAVDTHIDAMLEALKPTLNAHTSEELRTWAYCCSNEANIISEFEG